MKLLLAILLLTPQEGDNKPPDPAEINKAIERGTQILLRVVDMDAGHAMLRCDELILFALIHAGQGQHSQTRKLLSKIMATDLNKPEFPTYNVSLRAMALAELDKVKYQTQIAQCAWWLVNAQTDNGQWDYWTIKEKVPSSFAKVPWGGKQATGEKGGGKPEMGLQVKRSGKWADKPAGKFDILRNTSTAQYAVLGLYAAHRARVVIPDETWDRALQCTLTGQSKGGGWGYVHPGDKGNKWFMDFPGMANVNRSMTASQLSVLAVLKDVLETPPREIDTAMSQGFRYLAEDLILKRGAAMKGPTVDNTDTTGVYWHYWLYSVERAGILWGREKIGDKWWYNQGATELLKLQNEDGSWGQNYGASSDRPANTAFAVLFLKRAVPPPVATGGKSEEPKK